MKKLMLYCAMTLFTVSSYAELIVEQKNGSVIVQDEFVGPEKEQVRVRIFGDAARVLCSSLGLPLDQFEGKSFVGSKGVYTCLTTRMKGEFIAGQIVSRDGSVKNLEADGYN